MVNMDADVVAQTSTMVVASSKVSTTMITHVDVSTIREQEGAGQGHPKLDCQYVALDTVQNKYLRAIIRDGRVWLTLSQELWNLSRWLAVMLNSTKTFSLDITQGALRNAA